MIVKKDQDEIQNFLVDAANVKGFCDAVYFPENENDVIEIFKIAGEQNLKITISGNGTGLTGARVPKGGIVISTEKLNKILEINSKEKFAIVQPGVLLKNFQEEVEKLNLFYPPDPTERNCFIGANVATNASGAKTFKYGATRNFVTGLTIILANGKVLNLSRGEFKFQNSVLNLDLTDNLNLEFSLPKIKIPIVKNAAGYFIKEDMDLIDLFIGSEGTLGFISEIKLKLIDLPEKILSAVIFFDEENNAFQFINEAREISYTTRKANKINIDARALEFFDFNSLKLLKEDYPQIPENANAAVWFEQEINSENEEFIFEKLIELIQKYNANENEAWFASNKNELEKFKDFRHAISWKVSEFVAQKNITKVGTDIAIPDSGFIDFYFYLKNIAEQNNFDYVIYGHFGNSHYHLNLLPKNQDEHKFAKEIYKQICAEAVKSGGTISAEHGIGKLKTEYFKLMYSENEIRKMAKLKLQFDPKGILGIGNIFEEEVLLKARS